MKVYLDMVGCRLNQSELEVFARQFRAAGHVLAADPAEADLVVINTCAVTAAADADSRQKIRQAARAGSKIVVTGCWSTLHPEDAASLPNVAQVVMNDRKDALVGDVLHLAMEAFDLEPLARIPLPGARSRTRAFIKVQDGCNNRCTFCITTLARGAARSRSAVEVVEDIYHAREGGAQEIVLTGVHLGWWGNDLPGSGGLRGLIAHLLAETDTPRLRLSSLEPWDIEPGFFDLWQNPRLAPHLHLPLQSGCAATLRRMARKTTPESFARLLETVRTIVPEIAVTTDVITGFPGEDEKEFAESLAFVEQCRFSGGHVFTYSARPGTAAAKFTDQVPMRVRKERNQQMRQVLQKAAQQYQQQNIGKVRTVLWEQAQATVHGGWILDGLTENYLRVTAHHKERRWNQFDRVRLVDVKEDMLRGEIDEEF